MFRARFFDARRYDTSRRYCEDAALYLEATLAGPVRFANLPERSARCRSISSICRWMACLTPVSSI